MAMEMMCAIVESEIGVQDEIEEVNRLGKCKEGGVQTLIVKFQFPVIVIEVSERTWKLSKKEGNKNVWI